MSRWLHWINNRKQNFCLLYTIQRTAMERLDSITRRLRKESNKSNKHEQSGKSSESAITTYGNCTPATCTCARTSSRNGYRIPYKCTTGSTASSRSSTTGNTKGRSTKGRHTKSGSTAIANRECANDILAREYAEYLASTSAGRKDVSTRVWASNEPRDFKQADANSGDSIERCIGIPAGVTV